MDLTFNQRLPSPEEIINEQPISEEHRAVKATRDAEISKILTGEDDRFLVIVGPCSAHREDSVCEYTVRLAHLQEKVREKIILVPRIYTNKPRTTGVGYKGMLHQPDYHKEPDMVRGLKAIRHMHLRVLAETHLCAADEMLYPDNHPYLGDLLAYVAVGARSVENQKHRLTASGIGLPCGLKNPISGDLKILLDSIYAAQQSHTFSYNSWEVTSAGNPLAHAILRGSVDRYGNHIPNYHFEDMKRFSEMYQARGLKHPAIIVDTNHSNSGKQYKEQPRIALEILQSRHYSVELRKIIRGLMIESYLEEGSQEPDGNIYGKSITDPCLGWEDTEKLILQMAERLARP